MKHLKPTDHAKSPFSWALSTLKLIGLAGLMALALLLLTGHFGLVGFRAFTVQSDSMNPAIARNSVILTAQSESPSTGDVITFKLPDKPDTLITHRVVDTSQVGNETFYVTQGDANDDADGDLVPHDSVVGEVWLTIPVVGAVVNWAKTDLGFMVLVVIPATIIVYRELLNLRQQIRDRRSQSSVAGTTA